MFCVTVACHIGRVATTERKVRCIYTRNAAHGRGTSLALALTNVNACCEGMRGS
jgi:hypothetical protein